MTTLMASYLNESSSLLQVTKATIKAWMTLNFYQIQQPTTALECLKIQCLHFFSVAIELILFKLTDKDEMHTILDGQIGRQTIELSAHGYPKIPSLSYNGEYGVYCFSLFFFVVYLLENYSKYFDDLLALM